MKSYSDFLAELFDGKVQKLPLDTHRSCPNRDGSAGRGGCTYCVNAAFSPDGAKRGLSVREQIERGRRFFSKKYKSMRYLAYFQSYTSTHGDIGEVMSDFSEALSDEDVAGAIISTRPDCLPDELLTEVRRLPKPVIAELGAESTYDATLERVNRCHTWAQTVDAVLRCHAAGIATGLHLIMGLPGESEEMMLESVHRINSLPVSAVKFHHLQILRGTALGEAYLRGESLDIINFTVESYATLCRRLLSILRPDIAVERFVAQSPPGLLLAPRWGIKPSEFNKLLL